MLKLQKKFVTQELLDFKRFHVNVKNIKNPLQWWEKHEFKFHAVRFLTKRILGIIGSQIETKRIFPLVGILTSLRRYWLQSEILDILIFVSQNWPNDPRVGCTMSSTLGGVYIEGWICIRGVGGIWRGVWKGGNCRYELFIWEQIIFHHFWIYFVHHLLWL